MGPFLTICVLGLVMGIASFAAGCVPLVLSLNESRVRQISAIGIGILVGTSMIVIVPEGVDTLYKSNVDPSFNRQCVGLSLFFGFLLMYCIDKIPSVFIKGVRGSHAKPTDETIYMARMSSSRNSHDTSRLSHEDLDQVDRELDADFNMSGKKHLPVENSKSLSTMVGLVIHAFADGIALGASASSGSGTLELIVFIAIMVHKAPASFGLSTVLIRDNQSPRRVRLNLLIFASSAPLGALTTWLIILLLGSEDHDLIQWWTGSLLILSGGTFLFVAMHVMQELDENDGDTHREYSEPTPVSDLALSLVGMGLPLLTMFIPDVD